MKRERYIFIICIIIIWLFSSSSFASAVRSVLSAFKTMGIVLRYDDDDLNIPTCICPPLAYPCVWYTIICWIFLSFVLFGCAQCTADGYMLWRTKISFSWAHTHLRAWACIPTTSMSSPESNRCRCGRMNREIIFFLFQFWLARELCFENKFSAH